MRKKQQGYLLVAASLLIVIFGLLSAAVVSLFSSSADGISHIQAANKALFLAESGVDEALLALNNSDINARVSCNASATTITLPTGTITLAATNDPDNPINPTFSFATLSSASITTQISVSDSSVFASSGRVYIDAEAIDYGTNDTTTNRLSGLTRGANDTEQTNHASGASVSQYQCNLSSIGQAPSQTSPLGQRELQIAFQEPYVIAGGKNALLLEWNHPDTPLLWQNTLDIGNKPSINDISLLNTHQGWAAGDKNGNDYALARLNQGSWSSIKVSINDADNLQGVSAISSQEAWAVGNAAKKEFSLLRWLGGAAENWCRVEKTSSCGGKIITSSASDKEKELYAISMKDTSGDGFANIGFAVGGEDGKGGGGANRAALLQYNGVSWTDSTISSTEIGRLYGVVLTPYQNNAPIEAFAVGRSSKDNNKGKIIRWNGNAWQQSGGTMNDYLYAIDAIDTDNDGLANFAIAVGRKGIAYTYNGNNWSAAITIENNTDMLGVKIISATDAWVVGKKGARYHWDGVNFTKQETGVNTNDELAGIAAIAPKTALLGNWQEVIN